VELVLVVFMIVSSLNFATQYKVWVEHHPSSFMRDSEVRFHVTTLAVATVAVTLATVELPGLSWPAGLRQALLQVVSIGTTTGFVTADYEQWHPFAQLCLLALMYFGGNTSSTAGGSSRSGSSCCSESWDAPWRWSFSPGESSRSVSEVPSFPTRPSRAC